MSENSKAFRNIEQSFESFCAKLEELCDAQEIGVGDLQDGYSRLYRLRERYCDERASLTQPERNALSNVFEHDNFIRGLINIRIVGDHTEFGDTFQVSTPGNQPMMFKTEVSANRMFSSPIVFMEDTEGIMRRIDHLIMLKEGKRRIAKKMANAKQ